MEKVTGYVTGVNGNLVSARFSGSVRKNEVGFVKIGNDRLKGEVIRISGAAVSKQIYEMTNGIQVGEIVNVCADESVLTDGKIDPKKLKPIAFDPVNNTYLAMGDKVGDAFGSGKALK